MSRHIWHLETQKRAFYIRAYRKMLNVLLFSGGMNILLIVVAMYSYFHVPEPDYYASSGELPPVEMQVSFAPNDTSVPLLPTERLSGPLERPIPNE